MPASVCLWNKSEIGSIVLLLSILRPLKIREPQEPHSDIT